MLGRGGQKTGRLGGAQTLNEIIQLPPREHSMSLRTDVEQICYSTWFFPWGTFWIATSITLVP